MPFCSLDYRLEEFADAVVERVETIELQDEVLASRRRSYHGFSLFLSLVVFHVNMMGFHLKPATDNKYREIGHAARS